MQIKPAAEPCSPGSYLADNNANYSDKKWRKSAAGKQMSRADLGSVGQHQMPLPREAQVLLRSLLLSPGINIHSHLGLQAAIGALGCCCHQMWHNTSSENKGVFASLSKTISAFVFCILCLAGRVERSLILRADPRLGSADVSASHFTSPPCLQSLP